jgi:LysM repeat protein
VVFLALAFLVLYGSGGHNQSFSLGNWARGLIEESALAQNVSQVHSRSDLEDMNSFPSGFGSYAEDASPAPSTDATTVGATALLALNPPDGDYLDGFKADQVVKYTVQPGDTIGGIASNYDVSVDTIVWANKLKDPNALSLGQILKIPPVSGVIHTVIAGDTIKSVALKYKSSSAEIESFNKLRDGQSLVIGNELMVPGGELQGPRPSVKPAVGTIAIASEDHGIYKPVGNGQCVDFVQAHGYATYSGNANTWKRYINTPTPVVGGVVVLKGGRFGHVALVTSVKPSSIQVVEQNYYGIRIIDHREISLSDKTIVGFIQ